MNKIVKSLAVAVSTALAGSVQAALINEFQPNLSGADPVFTTVEIRGTSGAGFNGSILSIESDIPGAVVDRATSISGTFDSNGLLTASIPDFENPSFTLVLVEGFTGSIGDVLDTNSDGVLDVNPWSSVHDAIGVPDSFSDQSRIYGAQLGGEDFAYTGDEPKLVFRDGQTLLRYAINDPARDDA